MVPIAPFGIFGSVFQGSGGMVALAYVDRHGRDGVHRRCRTRRWSQAFPMAGSVYTYAGRGIAPPVGFLAGWVILLDYVLVPGLLYLVAARRDELARRRGAGVGLAGRLRRAQHRRELPRHPDDRAGQQGDAGRRADRAGDLPGRRHRRARAGQGPRVRLVTPLYNADTFSWSLVFGAVSIAVLSLPRLRRHLDAGRGEPEEAARAIGRAMVAALLLAGRAVHRADVGGGAARPGPAAAARRRATRAAPRSTTPPRVAGGRLAGRR